MSLKQTKHGTPGTRAPRGGGGKKSNENIKENPGSDPAYNENVVRRLYELFQDIFDYDLVASVCHTCQWDAAKATEALMVLGDAAHLKRQRNLQDCKGEVNKNKPKSLPSTLKPSKSESDKGNTSLYAMPSSLRSNPAHMSTSSLSSGQVWHRHYKSKPQSPGLLTMIPPNSKEGTKLKKFGTARSVHGQGGESKSKESPEVRQASATVKRIQHLVRNGVKVLILMRGLPGSGKTHLAQIVVNLVTHGKELGQHIFSTDDYFIMLGRGNYAYDFHQLPLAHNWNQRRVYEALRRATNPVVVDNTHTQAWEMEPYVTMAVSQGYLIEVLEPVTPWRVKEAELAKRNIHSVPREKIHQMLERYERGWTGEKLIQLFGLNYAPCGSAHVAQELTAYNSPLAQHRQQSVIDTPEKPKRKKNSPKRKDRKHVPGVEISEDKEKQLEELNQLFAEYGKTMDPLSKKKVLESGVPISEVVSRMRKLQGNILPLPKSNAYPSTMPEKDEAGTSRLDEFAKSLPNYQVFPRESPCESVEPDTMSSSNASETSECESDTEAELRNTSGFKGLFNYRASGQLGDAESIWKELNEANNALVKTQKRMGGSTKPHSGITSSQEELSIIDYELSTNPACSSQEELSLIDFEDGHENKKSKEGSSSSSEEQETQLLSLQESLREVLIDSYEKRKHMEEQADKSLAQVPEHEDLKNKEPDSSSAIPAPERADGFMNVLSKRLEDIHIKESRAEDSSVDNVIVDYLLKSCDAAKAGESNDKIIDFESGTHTKRSPDLEEVPLPSIPSGFESDKVKLAPSQAQKSPNKKETIDDLMKAWESPREKSQKPEIQPKPERPKSGLLGAIKKTGIQRDQSPEELLRSIELSWSSIPFTSSWEETHKKAAEQKDVPQRSKSQRKIVSKADSSTNTKHADFHLWKDEKSDVVKLTTQNRNINQGLSLDSEAQHHATEFAMLDKGSMTSDWDEYESITLDDGLELLSGMFPNILPEDLADVLEKCKGNINWAAELLLESPHNIKTCLDRKPSSEDTVAAAASADNVNKIPENLVISDGKKTIKRRKDRKSAPSELSLILKKQIEDGIHINEECYQEKTLFIKHLRHGDFNLGHSQMQLGLGDPGLGQPVSTPRDSEEPPQQMDNNQEEEEEEETIPMKIDPDFFRQLALHFGHFVEPDQIESPHSAAVVNIPVSLGYQIYSHWLETVNRQIEEMQTAYDNMMKEDELLAKALQEQEHSQHKPDLREIMDMELAMALYKQDEESVCGIKSKSLKKLSVLDEITVKTPLMPPENECEDAALLYSLRIYLSGRMLTDFEISDLNLLQVPTGCYLLNDKIPCCERSVDREAEIDKMSCSEQSRAIYEDTMACKLSKQLLFESYPNIDQKVILDMFRRQGYSFHKTIELLDSQKGDTPITVIAPELLQAYQSKLFEEAKQESEKEKAESLRKPIIVVKQTGSKKSTGESKDVLVVNPAEFRQNMTLLQKRRYDCCRQAQEAFRNKNYYVASYYSHLASLYKERISEMNKNCISWEIFDENRSDSSPKQVDLHFLFVNEAVRVVDLFLDYHIKDLNRRNISSLDLGLITGRGLNSRCQKPKVKPAIKKRLEQRKIPYVEQNPGMLKVTIHKGDILSGDL